MQTVTSDIRSKAEKRAPAAALRTVINTIGVPEVIDRSPCTDGTDLLLTRCDGFYQIRVDGRELMNSSQHLTELELARIGLRYLACDACRVLVGGLGMGFTLRAALDLLAPDARVTVVEISPAVIRWNEGPLAPLADRPLSDPRAVLEMGDVLEVLRRSDGVFDAVLLDVDNGPHDLALRGNQELYDPSGLTAACRALRPGGVLAFWSSEPAPEVVERLLQIGMAAWSEQVCPVIGDTRIQHTIVLASRPDRRHADHIRLIPGR